MIISKDNRLLVEFDFLFDLDLAMYKLIMSKYGNSPYLNPKYRNIRNEADIIKLMLYRKDINPLKILFNQGIDTDPIYEEIMNDKNNYIELLEFCTVYETFGLMITFLKEASSVSIDVLCKNTVERAVVNAHNPLLYTMIEPDKKNIDISGYTALYLKYFSNVTQYDIIQGKHIYIPAARYNMEPEEDSVKIDLARVYGQNNEIHLIDLYRNINFRFDNRKEDE